MERTVNDTAERLWLSLGVNTTSWFAYILWGKSESIKARLSIICTNNRLCSDSTHLPFTLCLTIRTHSIVHVFYLTVLRYGWNVSCSKDITIHISFIFLLFARELITKSSQHTNNIFLHSNFFFIFSFFGYCFFLLQLLQINWKLIISFTLRTQTRRTRMYSICVRCIAL